MAKEKHFKILKQGAEAWNKWRDANPGVYPELSYADLRKADLSELNLSRADLSSADLCTANLSGSGLSEADLNHTDMRGANLTEAELSYANLSGVDLTEANLSGADLTEANLTEANLSNVDLSAADLRGANFRGTVLTHTIFSDCFLSETIFAHNDISKAIDLEYVSHFGPSYIGTTTLKNSGGRIPEDFLRGCGLSDWEIESAKLYKTNLSTDEIDNILYRVHDLRAGQAIQISPLFISYSHADSRFIDAIEKHLNERGIRFWRDIHHATAGRLEKVIDRAIKHNPTVLLVLSKNSVNSDWVQHEARLARKLEIETGRDVLCPVALDNSWEDCKWPERLREQIMEYHILDFSDWQDRSSLDRMFSRLINGLNLFYEKPPGKSET